jgi:hypothetical protein
MEFIHDHTEPPSPELICSLATSASQSYLCRNHAAEFGATNQPLSTSEEELFGLFATTEALLCDYSVWESQQAEITAPCAHSQGQSHGLVNSSGGPTILQQPKLPLCSSSLTTPAS